MFTVRLSLQLRIDEGMPMVYWVSTENPATICSICLPPMLNIVRRLYADFLLPIASRISSVTGSVSTKASAIKSRTGLSDSNFQQLHRDSDINLQIVPKGANY